ncbi:unnamed protein product [Rangifer tarandus platyrhynchus]|uniref:Uncharacterized protein n=1 Tax=Rangifer tarandus platyrhynchus TaxID=3082113 RepID=A0ABN8XL53_RANTA|nr:unnamed protein product [Rangifer tarandus platyrhynchus]
MCSSYAALTQIIVSGRLAPLRDSEDDLVTQYCRTPQYGLCGGLACVIEDKENYRQDTVPSGQTMLQLQSSKMSAARHTKYGSKAASCRVQGSIARDSHLNLDRRTRHANAPSTSLQLARTMESPSTPVSATEKRKPAAHADK